MRVQFKKIICATDFSDISNQTIPYGAALASEFGAKLYVCHIIDLSSVAIYGEFQLDPVGLQSRIKKDAQDQLEEMLGDHPLNWEPLITVGQTADEICRLVEENDVDLVITATRGRSGIKRLILGSVTERLMRTLPCPLLVVQGPEKESPISLDKEIKLNKILVGCDFSIDSTLAFENALSLAQEFQSELHLVHVLETPTNQELAKPSKQMSGEIQDDLEDLLIKKLQDMVPEEARNWCVPQTILASGRPYEELVNYSESNEIDLIVLGIRGHGLVKTLFLGSTTDRVVRHSPCPVLSVATKSPAE